MKNKDVIPKKDGDFENFQANLISLCTTNQVAWGIVLLVLNALTPLQTAWVAAYGLCKNKKNATAIQRLAKNAAKKAYVSKLRSFIQTQIQYNTAMTDTQKQSVGVTPKGAHRTQIPVPDTRPMLDIERILGNSIKLRYRQEMGSDGTSRRGKPEDVAFCKIVYVVATVAPATPDACPNEVFSTRSPETLAFDITQSGKKVFGFACWTNIHHEDGPWSEMWVCTIP